MNFPPVIFGTSSLGNLYEELPYETKRTIVKAYFESVEKPAVFDSAGKYGAGLALETLGSCLRDLGVSSKDVIISNKLGWLRSPLRSPESTSEPGVWKNLQYDAVQRISYRGILDCFEQGNELLQTYTPQLVSVHDPDEYLNAAADEADEKKRHHDILEAYRALNQLKKEGKVQAIGVGSKSWETIARLYHDVAFDWVMLANSLTIYHHPVELLRFVERLRRDGVTIINSAVFNGGFLIGSNFFNYRPVDAANPKDNELLQWREKFYAICNEYSIKPAEACVYFGKHIPGVESIAMNSTSPERMRQNMEMVSKSIPAAFWEEMKEEGLISREYPYL